MSLEYIREVYQVPAKKGGRVSAYGKPGTIIGARNQYLLIRLDEEKHSNPYHPTHEIEYLVQAAVSPDVAGNPFIDPNKGHGAVDVESRCRAVESFNLEECNAALGVPGLQKSVETKLRSRIRRLEKLATASKGA